LGSWIIKNTIVCDVEEKWGCLIHPKIVTVEERFYHRDHRRGDMKAETRNMKAEMGVLNPFCFHIPPSVISAFSVVKKHLKIS